MMVLRKNYHIAVGSKGKYELGDWHKVAVMDADDLRPLKILKEPTAQVTELKYSPDTKGIGQGGYLAAGSQDMHIYIYSCSYDYQLISKCTGHSGCVIHIDWTLPISVPGTKLNGTMIIKAVDESKNLLYWDPKTGKKIMQNQRDAPMDTDTSRVGFNVMGIWPDASSFDDVNSVCASTRGSPWFDPVVSVEGCSVDLREVAKNLAEQKGSRVSVQGEAAISNMADLLALKAVKAESEGMSSEYFGADGVPGGGYLVTADDYSTIKLFNYPVVWDDAPYKAFRGHASFIQCVRFNCDDGLVLSAGGHDRGIYQWRTIGMSLPEGMKGESPGKTLSEDEKKKMVVDKILHDKKILMIRHRLIESRRDNNLSDQPTPGVEWGPVDGTGKVFGPKVADSSKRQDQEYARMEELRASGSLLVSKKEEATITPGKQTMLNRR
jgi:WD40 repeat protein